MSRVTDRRIISASMMSSGLTHSGWISNQMGGQPVLHRWPQGRRRHRCGISNAPGINRSAVDPRQHRALGEGAPSPQVQSFRFDPIRRQPPRPSSSCTKMPSGSRTNTVRIRPSELLKASIGPHVSTPRSTRICVAASTSGTVNEMWLMPT